MLKSLFPGLLWALTILMLSAHPQMAIVRNSWVLQPDKIAHAGAYALLAFLLRFYFKQPITVVLLGTGYGILIEFMQRSFFHGRQLDVLDMLANFIGCLIGVGVFPFFMRFLSFMRK